MRFRLILIAAALVAFGGALAAPFQFDDFSLVDNAQLESPDGWRQAFAAGQTRPLTYLTFWAQAQTAAPPWSHHLISLLLHLACVVLVYESLMELLPFRAAEVGALLFALHPLQTEAVVYVFARATLLAAVFALSAVLLWTRRRLWPAVAACALALLAKEEAAALPLLLALIEWATRRQRASLAPLGAMAALVAAAGTRAVWAAGATPGSGAGAQAGVTAFEYFSYQGVSVLRYLWLLLVPLGQSVDADVRVEPLTASFAWGVVAVLALLSWRGVRLAREGFWILGGLLLLAPSSSIFPAADLSAERRMYLPMFCFCALVGLLVQKADRRLVGAYLVVLAALSVAQTSVWRSPQALWMQASRQAPDKIRPKRQLARLVAPEQAVELLDEARRTAPMDADLASDYGVALLRAGKPELALSEFGRALALSPSSATAIHNRGLALYALGDKAAARADFERALEGERCLFDAYSNLRRLGVERTPPAFCQWTRAQRAAISAR